MTEKDVKKEEKEEKLTPRQERFCQEYIVDFNALQSAIRAGYKADSAGSMGCNLLKNRKVAERIAILKEERMKRVQISADEILYRLSLLSRANISKFCYKEGNHFYLKEDVELTEEDWYVIDELIVDDTKYGKRTRVKLVNKLSAIELAGKHMAVSAFRDKVENSVSFENPVQIVLPDNGRN